ncbi:hypothetical protein GGI05_005119, partial [Coemansia sp. RSA 2603]
DERSAYQLAPSVAHGRHTIVLARTIEDGRTVVLWDIDKPGEIMGQAATIVVRPVTRKRRKQINEVDDEGNRYKKPLLNGASGDILSESHRKVKRYSNWNF